MLYISLTHSLSHTKAPPADAAAAAAPHVDGQHLKAAVEAHFVALDSAKSVSLGQVSASALAARRSLKRSSGKALPVASAAGMNRCRREREKKRKRRARGEK